MEHAVNVKMKKESSWNIKRLFWGVLAIIAIGAIVFFGPSIIISLIKLIPAVLLGALVLFIALVIVLLAIKLFFYAFAVSIGIAGFLFFIMSLVWLFDKFF